MVAGFTSVGMDVVLLGPMPTPAVAMLTRSMRADLGVMISAHRTIPSPTTASSCSAPTATSSATRTSGRSRQRLEQGTEARQARADRPRPADRRRARPLRPVRQGHLSRAPAARRAQGRVDCANGAAYHVAPEALWELGAEVIPLGVTPDGLNINDDCGSTAPAAAAGDGGRERRRHRHRARRRRRPADRRRREGPDRRRRPADGADRARPATRAASSRATAWSRR